jgi:predicted MPP superfamily phosphohydrolase
LGRVGDTEGRRGGPSGPSLDYLPGVFSFRSWFAIPLWLAGAACLALPIVERALVLPESARRYCFIVAVLVSLTGGALWAARNLRAGPLRLLPWAILLIALGNEGLEGLKRQRDAASAPVRSVGVAASLWRPITTTDLVIHFFELPEPALRVRRLRVAQISDLHISSRLPKAYFEAALDSVVAQNPDLILVTGDNVSEPGSLPLLSEVLGSRLHARFGVFAVLGNHDWWAGSEAVTQTLSAAGITRLGSGCVRLPEAVGRVAVCGSEAPWGPKLETPLAANDLSLVLTHTPDNIYDLAAQGASVVFAGHTHGGQMRLPGFGAVVIPSRYGRRFDEGHFRVNATDLFVSAGLGAYHPPLRLYCRPDVIVVDFVNDHGV